MISLGIHPPASSKPAQPLSTTSPEKPPVEPAPEDVKAQLQGVIGTRFQVLEPVATGGMATLYQLRHRLHGGLFAAKVLHKELAARPEVIESFRREARHAARLGDHPNAIPILDAGESDGISFLLMPFIEGEDLDHLIAQSGPLSRTEALHFAAQISSLLCHAESHGITHSDLAPGNIRLDIFGRYRLMDFGISQENGDPATKLLGGTPLYSSPEQVRGEALDIRSDLYSLGLVLVETITGTPLLQASTLDEIRHKHLHATWELPATIKDDAPLSRLVQRMTCLDREGRFRSAFELSGALAAMGFERPEFRPRPQGMRHEAPSIRRSRLS